MRWLIVISFVLAAQAAFADHIIGPTPDGSITPYYDKVPASLSTLRVGHVVEPLYETHMKSGNIFLMYLRPGDILRVERIHYNGWFYTSYDMGVETIRGWVPIRDVYIRR